MPDSAQVLKRAFDPTNNALKILGGGTGSGESLAKWTGTKGADSGQIDDAAVEDDGVYTRLPAPNAAPTDADISNNYATFYLDEAGAALKVRVRKSDGTYLTGTIALV